MSKEEIKKLVVNYLTEHVFSGKLPLDFTNDTLIISTRLVNSIIVLHMINYLEEMVKIEFEAHEINVDNIDSVNLITEFVAKKCNAA